MSGRQRNDPPSSGSNSGRSGSGSNRSHPYPSHHRSTSRSDNSRSATNTPLPQVLLVFLLLLSVAELIYNLAYWSPHSNSNIPEVDLIAPAVRAIAMLVAGAYTAWDHKYARSSSGILSLFWLLMMFCEAINFWNTIEVVQKATEHPFISFLRLGWLPLIFMQFILTTFFGGSISHHSGMNPNPEESASFFSQLTFWWFNRMGILGWRRPLLQKDMYDMQSEDSAHVGVTELQKNWEEEVITAKRNQKDPSFFQAMFRTFWKPLSATLAMRVLNDVLIFVSPVILQLLINFVESKTEHAWKGYFYTVAMLLTQVCQTILLNFYLKYCFRFGLHMKSAVIAAVYRKALRITSAVKQASSVGEIVNLMSIDAQRFVDFMGFIHVLWSGPVQITLAVLFLQRLFGTYPALAGLAAILITLPLNAYTFSRVGLLQSTQMKEKDGRIKLMNEILNGIKVLKLYAWEVPFQDEILKIRDRELRILRKAANYGVVSYVAWIMSPYAVALATFATYVLLDPKNQLTGANVFVALSITNILRVPLSLLSPAVLLAIQVGVAIKRISKFLKNEELNPNNVQPLPLESPNGVTIANGTFTWNDTDAVCLKDININVPNGKLVAIVGQVGSGKSSVCSAMLGLMEKISGTVGLKGEIAYVPQQAWIQNLTVKENILFGKEMRREYYDKVIKACALTTDLESLPAGDETEIGERGTNMSGGQRQRISLARATYTDAEVYIFDDPLSAVDAHVGKHIFEQVIGPRGLLKGKTRVLVTHGIGFLPQVDQIIVLNNGTVSETGTYKELLHNNGAFAEFLRTYVTEAMNDEETADPEVLAVTEQILEEIADEAGSMALRKVSRSSLKKVRDVFRRASMLSEKRDKKQSLKEAAEKETAEKGKLVEEEKAEVGIVKWSVYLMFFKQMSYAAGAALVILYGIYSGLGIAGNFWLTDWAKDSEKNWTEIGLDQITPQRDFRLGVYGGYGLAQILFGLMFALVLASARIRAGRKLHEHLLARILRAPMSFFDTTPIGRIVNRFSRDIDTVDILIPGNLDFFLYCIFGVVSTVVVVLVNNYYFIALVVPLGIFYFFMQRFFISTSRQLKRLESVTRSPIFSHFQESIAGTGVIIATKQTDRFILHNERLIDINNSSFYLNIVAARWISVRLECLGILITFAVALFSVISRNANWNIDPDQTGLSISYSLSVNVLLNWLLWVSSEMESNIVSVERIKEYTEVPQEAQWINTGVRPSPGWPQAGHVEFKNYQTRYRPGLDLVLKGIDAQIKSGEKIGIVGRTGAGKSSMTLALFRIIEAAGGAINIDDVNIADLGLHDVRSRITILPQEPVLFTGTLRMNLDPYKKHTDEEIWSALEHSHLKRFVSTLPEGLQHNVVDGGENYSVGQRQLICLARALLRKTKILVLDEATAAIDLQTDDLIQQTIRDKFADCTILTIAHRINTIMDSDRIMVLNAGFVQEFASPADLLQDHNGLFYSLAKTANLVD
ncbi:multidrug resistance-associated protein 1-like isoform X2 [Paramacrobiotus metropolitanus]|uniref:multidrug resistance-associated protein 1-like isoform X2 n=1 Tax=Paramacrobiotus metropolitanus TaxID=2943436 RepID=UPI0024456A01|nr:multidrug resistance-associated protein 1-like isoform X2 [Paramacrobiotus metropolitanus]